MEPIGFNNGSKLYFVDTDGTMTEIQGVTDVTPTIVGIHDPDPDPNVAPFGFTTREVTVDVSWTDVRALERVFARMTRITRAQTKKLNHRVAIATHHLKIFERIMSKEDPASSKMHSEYRRRTKNRNKRRRK